MYVHALVVLEWQYVAAVVITFDDMVGVYLVD